MPSLRLNIGLNNGRKLPFGGGAAPSGIIASTAGDLILLGILATRNMLKPQTHTGILIMEMENISN
jgi:hypothetical protein